MDLGCISCPVFTGIPHLLDTLGGVNGDRCGDQRTDRRRVASRLLGKILRHDGWSISVRWLSCSEVTNCLSKLISYSEIPW